MGEVPRTGTKGYVCKYTCVICEKSYSTPKLGPTECIYCTSRYVKWDNYDEYERLRKK